MTTKVAVFAFVAAGFLIPAAAHATTVSGKVTAFSPASITVLDKEAVTVGLNTDTIYTKLIVQKPWQEDTALTAAAVRMGGYVVVHVPESGGFIANWVQVATTGGLLSVAPISANLVGNVFYTDEAAKHVAEANARRTNPTASESKRPGAVDTAAYHERLAALGRTTAIGPAAPATAVSEEVAKHRAEAAARRANPTASESKRPGSVDTAAHCDRLAGELEKAGK